MGRRDSATQQEVNVFAKPAEPNPPRKVKKDQAYGEYEVALKREVFERKQGETFLAEEVGLTKPQLEVLIEAGLVKPVPNRPGKAEENEEA